MTGYLSATPSTVQQIAAGVNTAQTNRGDLAGVTAAQSGGLLLAAQSPPTISLPVLVPPRAGCPSLPGHHPGRPELHVRQRLDSLGEHHV